MYESIGRLTGEQRILDVASGPGSFPSLQINCKATLLDEDREAFATAGPLLPGYSRVFGRSDQIPVRSGSIDLVICHHALEHVVSLDETLREISRVLKSDGRFFVSVPNGYGLCDWTYRFLFEGGGHVNRFRRDDLIRRVEEICGLRLVRWYRLYSSFAYLYRLSEMPPNPGLRGRLALLVRLPGSWLRLSQQLLYCLTRSVDWLLASELSVYGWALSFGRFDGEAAQTAGFVNVCLKCGVGHPAAGLPRPSRITYICPQCGYVNPYFRPHGRSRA